jgi:hypothetical protein
LTFDKNERNGEDEAMARPLRIEDEGAFYQVMKRELEWREIFQEDRQL